MWFGRRAKDVPRPQDGWLPVSSSELMYASRPTKGADTSPAKDPGCGSSRTPFIPA